MFKNNAILVSDQAEDQEILLSEYIILKHCYRIFLDCGLFICCSYITNNHRK